MFGRFLSFLGFIPGLSGLSGFAGGYGGGGGGADEDMEAGGEASVSFVPGKALASADAEETPDSRQARITDRDLVWPGKIENIQISNPEPIAYRFDLTVTDLNPAFYIRRPPVGGVPQREGGVLLQPGDEASFEVAFVPPPTGEKLRTRTFGFVLTCFDPRRSGDPGEIVQDMPLRWVGLPGESDLQIAAVPPVIVTRPWSREARFAIKLTNKSFLPPNVGLTILRAPTKDALAREAETVGDIQQALAARTPGVWQCLLPPSARRGSYYATVRGTASAAGGVSTPLALPRPVLVRYVPWLRMGRDWAILLGTLTFLFWLVWGFPVRKTPIVRVALNFAGLPAGQPPADTQLKDLSAQMILLDDHGHDLQGQTPISSLVTGGAYEFVGPTRWYGFHWPFGRSLWWNPWSREQQSFRVAVAAAEADKGAFHRYDLNAVQANGKAAYDASESESPLGPLIVPTAFTVPTVPNVLVKLQLANLGALAGKDLRRITVRYTLDEQQQPLKTFKLVRDSAGGLEPITLDLTDAVPIGGQKSLGVTVIAAGLSSYATDEVDVKRRSDPLLIALTFPPSYPANSQNTTAQPANEVPEKIAAARSAGGKGAAGEGAAGKGAGQNAGTIKSPAPIKPYKGSVAVLAKSPGSRGGTAPAHTGPIVKTLPYTPPTPTLTMPNVKPNPVEPPPLEAPEGLVARAVSPTQINVHWDSVPGGVLYLIYRSGGAGGGKWPHTTHNNFWADTEVAPGALYQYRVQSKQDGRMSRESNQTLAMAQPLVPPVATVALTVSTSGREVHAALDFANVSSHPVYLDRVSACAGGKIGDDVFHIILGGQALPFTGRQSTRPARPGPRQFITLAAGQTFHQDVVLNHSYRFPPGVRGYAVTYAAPHVYRDGMQSLILKSNEVLDTPTQ